MIRRHFLHWNRPLLPQAAALLVERYAGTNASGGPEGEARMSEVVVVLPGSRAGRRLKELLLDEAEARGLRLVPPRIVTQGVAPELLYDADRSRASGTFLRLVWAESLRLAAASPREREGLERVFAALPGSGEGAPGSLREWTPLARELSQLARTVAAGGYRFREVADRCSESGFHDDGPRWRTLAGIQARVEARLGQLGFVDRDLERMRALEEGEVRLPGAVWLVGVAEMPGVLRRMLERCVQDGSGPALECLVHAPEEEARGFDTLGCVVRDHWVERELAFPDDAVTVAERPGDQGEAVARILRGLDGRYASDEIAIGVPDAELIPVLEQRLPASGVEVRSAAGSPLSASGPYRLLRAAGEYLTDRRWEAFSMLVRHPDLAPTLRSADPDPLSAVDGWYARHLPDRVPTAFPATPTREEERAARVVRGVDELLGDLAGRPRTLRDWMEPVLRLLARAYSPHGLTGAREWERTTLRALEALRQAAEALARIPGGLDVPCDAPAAIRFLLEEAGPTQLPPPPREDAVEMMGWLELHLDDAPVTVVTGVNEGSLPESVRGDVFLPDRLRGVLGLEDNAQRLARDLYRMAAILQSREVLHLVAGRRTSRGDPLRPSRVLFATDGETAAARILRFLGSESPGSGAAGDPGTRTEEGGRGPEEDAAAADASGFRLPPEDPLELGPFPAKMGVTEFSRIIADPYEWALGKLHRLETLDDRAMELDGGGFGDLAHRVLQDFGQQEVERHAAGTVVTDPDEIWKLLEPILDRRVTRLFGPGAGRTRVAVRLQVEQLRSRLRAFAAWHGGWVGKGWRVRAVEAATPEGGVPFDFGGSGEARSIGLAARIDRMDQNVTDGRWAIMDYKTSDAGDGPEKTHRKGSGDQKVWIDLQLPLYRWLAPHLSGPGGGALIPDGASVEVGYVVLPRTLAGTKEEMAPWDDALLESGVERARELLRELASGPVRFQTGRRATWPQEEMEALLGRSVLTTADGDGEDDG